MAAWFRARRLSEAVLQELDGLDGQHLEEVSFQFLIECGAPRAVARLTSGLVRLALESGTPAAGVMDEGAGEHLPPLPAPARKVSERGFVAP